jgi:methionyl aminopeptidase
MVELKTAAEIDAMAAAGAVVSEALQAIVEHAKPGQPTAELNQVAADVLARHGARSPFLNYHPRWAPTPFPAVLCVSVNDAVVHGIPNGEVLTDGDLVSVDFGAILKGWCGDAARSFIVGTPRAQDTALIEATDEALAAGIAAVRPGNTLGDVGHAIAAVARGAGYGLLADHGGHGIGRTMHEDPHVPNEGRPGKGMRLRPGLVRDRADADRRRHRRLHPRPGRLDAPHRVGRPRRAQRALRRGHRRRAPHPDVLNRSPAERSVPLDISPILRAVRNVRRQS